jgi:hypothetical protein
MPIPFFSALNKRYRNWPLLVTLTFLLFCAHNSESKGVEVAGPNWGTEQLTRLLHDRPELQSIVKTGNKISDWLVVAFGNRSQGITIHWDGGPLSSSAPFDGESQWLDNDKNVYVRVGRYYRTGSSVGLERRPEEILFSIVFELNNVKYRQENLKIRELARAGAITRNDYVVAIAKCEYQALQETGEFYRNVWTPFCVDAGFNSDPKIWITARDVTFDNWISQYPPDFYYPWRFYGAQYDEIRQLK